MSRFEDENHEITGLTKAERVADGGVWHSGFRSTIVDRVTGDPVAFGTTRMLVRSRDVTEPVTFLDVYERHAADNGLVEVEHLDGTKSRWYACRIGVMFLREDRYKSVYDYTDSHATIHDAVTGRELQPREHVTDRQGVTYQFMSAGNTGNITVYDLDGNYVRSASDRPRDYRLVSRIWSVDGIKEIA